MNKTGKALPVNTLSFFPTDFADNWSRLNKGDINVWAPFIKVIRFMMYKDVKLLTHACVTRWYTNYYFDGDTITMMMRKSVSYKTQL